MYTLIDKNAFFKNKGDKSILGQSVVLGLNRQNAADRMIFLRYSHAEKEIGRPMLVTKCWSK